MSSARALTLAAPLALALCLAAPQARAQSGGGGDAAILMVLIAPPALASLIFDAVNLATLANGYAWRGPAITGLVFGGVTTLLSFLALAAGLTGASTWEYFVPIGATGIALGLATVLLGIYSLTRPPPPNLGVRPLAARAAGEVSFLPTVYAVRGGLGAAALLSVSL